MTATKFKAVLTVPVIEKIKHYKRDSNHEIAWIEGRDTGEREQITVVMAIDLDHLIGRLGRTAWRNNKKTSRAMNGAIVVMAKKADK